MGNAEKHVSHRPFATPAPYWPPAGIRHHPDPCISRWSCGPLAVPGFELIHDAFAHWARCQPEAIAAIHGRSRITYAALDQQSDALASELLRLGVQPGDAVAVFVRRSLPMLAAMLAVLKVGACYVPQDVRIAPPAVLRHILAAAGCRVMLCLREDLPDMPCAEAVHRVAIEDFTCPARIRMLHMRPRRPLVPDDLCFILFTSGTTGTPNGVRITHRNLCNIVLCAPGNLQIGPGTHVSQLLNIAFDMSAWEIHGALAQGGTLILRGSDFQQAASQAEVIIATPSILGRLQRDRCLRVRTVAVAGEPCPEHLAAHWCERAEFFNGCGPTETTIVNTLHRYQRGRGPLTIGRPTPNNTVYVLDEDLQPCAPGQPGELWAGGVGVSAGYLDNPALNAERYRPDPFLGGGWRMFRTRDLGCWTADGQLQHLGRTDDQVKIRGFRVELDAVSRVLEQAPGIEQAATVKTGAGELIAFVVPATADIGRARAQVEQALPYYCVPARIIARDTLPITERGKIDKRALLALEADGPAPVPCAATTPLPPPRPLARVGSLPWLSPYHRLFALVLAANALFAVAHLDQPGWWTVQTMALSSVAGMVVLNFSAALLIRQSLVINLLFRLATCVPTRWPLAIRRRLAKVYHFGGIHSACASAGTAWLLVLVVLAVRQGEASRALAWTAGVQLLLALLMVALALPGLRARHHDAFERVHRIAGWLLLLVSWQLALLLSGAHLGEPATLGRLLETPLTAVMALATASVLLPWLRLRRIPARIERLSRHAAVVTLRRDHPPFTGSSTAISRSPLWEWHSFANIPSPGQADFRLIVSRAGDWTGRLIDERPRHLWVKGFTTAGVAHIEVLFRSVVYVATGSGIGPVLPHLLASKVPMRLIWSTRDPRATYGDALVDEILAAQPDALIWDTNARGKPDLLQLAWDAARDFNAEAVICIANRRLTEQLVHGCEARGLPAYGAIWDS